MAQIEKRGEQTYRIKIFLGRDEQGTRHFHTETLHCSRKDAGKKATALERRRDLGENIEPVAALLETYLDEWLNVIRPNVAARTYESYRSLIETHVKPAIGWKRLAALTALDIEGLYSAMKSANKSRRTVA